MRRADRRSNPDPSGGARERGGGRSRRSGYAGSGLVRRTLGSTITRALLHQVDKDRRTSVASPTPWPSDAFYQEHRRCGDLDGDVDGDRVWMDVLVRLINASDENGTVRDNGLRVLASVGLAVGGIFGMAGTFAPSASLRGLAWGIDGVGLVMAGAVLTLVFYRKGQDLVASGFLVFAVGEGVILSGAAMDLTASVPSFGAGTSLWALALVLISIPRVFPLPVRLLGLFAAVLFAATAVPIFAGVQVLPTTSPLPFYAYPVLVATLGGWIWTLVKANSSMG